MDANDLYKRSAIARSILRKTLAHADVITGCSDYVVRELDRFTQGQFSKKMRVIHNGIDLAECAGAIPESRSRPYILGAGRLVAQKGYDSLIRAFHLLAPEFPNHKLLIAGDGPQFSVLQALVETLEIKSQVCLLGMVDHERVLSLMAGADAFALCSYHEPQGIVVLEAMAVGTPVVASAVGGVPEIVDDSNGFLYPAGNHRALACTLRELLLDDATAAGVSRAGRATATRFSWSALTGEYQSAYMDAGALLQPGTPAGF
jgi:1,4-alpha-glucan branching enzyme